MTQATLSLNFQFDVDRTVLNVLRQEPPWRALRAFRNDSGEALIHLHNVSGGILGGDNLHLEATLHPGAQAQITAVGATRVYRCRSGQNPSSQSTHFHIGSGALLEYLPDTVIPYAHSRFEKKSEIHLEEGAGVIWWETLSAGRIASGERFAFDHVSVDTAIYAKQQPIAIERYALQPKLQELESPARFGKYAYSTTMYVCREGKPLPEWTALERELNELAMAISSAETKWGVSTLVSSGLVIRGMSKTAAGVSEGLRTLWQTAKQKVFGRPALAPRKIY